MKVNWKRIISLVLAACLLLGLLPAQAMAYYTPAGSKPVIQTANGALEPEDDWDEVYPYGAFALDAAARERWAKLVSLRDAVNKALENARAAGVFKKAQDTEVTLSVAEQKDADFLSGVDLATLCIVSRVTVTTGAVEGEKMADCLIPCTIVVKLSEAPKCVRCWNHNEHVGEDHDHPELCPRCAGVVRAEA